MEERKIEEESNAVFHLRCQFREQVCTSLSICICVCVYVCVMSRCSYRLVFTNLTLYPSFHRFAFLWNSLSPQARLCYTNNILTVAIASCDCTTSFLFSVCVSLSLSLSVSAYDVNDAAAAV
jgi:hypothetical protein